MGVEIFMSSDQSKQHQESDNSQNYHSQESVNIAKIMEYEEMLAGFWETAIKRPSNCSTYFETDIKSEREEFRLKIPMLAS